MIFLILGSFLLIALIDFVPLVRYKQTKTAIIFGIIFVCTFAFSLLMYLEIKIPSIIQLLSNFLDLIGLHY